MDYLFGRSWTIRSADDGFGVGFWPCRQHRWCPVAGEDRYPRAVEALIEDQLLEAFPAILVVGPRGCGKTTSTARFADSIFDLSEPGVRNAVRDDPDGVLATAPQPALC